MKTIRVKINPDGVTGKEVNEVTNPKMGKRHESYESMLRTFEIVGEYVIPTPHKLMKNQRDQLHVPPEYFEGKVYNAEIQGDKIKIVS